MTFATLSAQNEFDRLSARIEELEALLEETSDESRMDWIEASIDRLSRERDELGDPEEPEPFEDNVCGCCGSVACDWCGECPYYCRCYSEESDS
jgi:hypothetical protein